MSQWLCVVWGEKVVEPAGQFVGATREIEHTVLTTTRFKPLSYVVSRGQVAPVVRTPQQHQTQAATVHPPTPTPHCRQDSNQIGLCLSM